MAGIFKDRPLYTAIFYIAVFLSLGVLGIVGFYVLLNDKRDDVRKLGMLIIVFSLAYKLIELLIGGTWINAFTAWKTGMMGALV